VVLRQLRNAGLKVNAAKLTFCALEIEYLGYALTRDGIKPQSNNVQANATMPQKDISFNLIEGTKVLCKNGKSVDSNISLAQGSKLVPPLPPTPWAFTSQGEDKIHDVLERYAYYHPEIRQILQILLSQ
jgi:hypothetical protein